MSEERTTTLRLRRVRFKNGPTIEIFRPREKEAAFREEWIKRDVEEVLACQGDLVAGYVFMVWSKDGGSTAAAQSDGSIPSILVPDFVRNRLLARQIENWTIDTLNGK